MNHDQPTVDENIESSTLEWGPELGKMSWDEAQAKIEELNKNLVEGEKPWRLPESDEIAGGFNFEKRKVVPTDFKDEYYFTFHPPTQRDPKYNYGAPDDYAAVDMSDGARISVLTSSRCYVRLVR